MFRKSAGSLLIAALVSMTLGTYVPNSTGQRYRGKKQRRIMARVGGSKYLVHQSAKECSRRVRQMSRGVCIDPTAIANFRK